MSLIKAGIASLSVLLAACATTSESVARDPGLEDMRAVSPALAYNTEHVLLGEVWKRPVCRRAIAASSPSRC